MGTDFEKESLKYSRNIVQKFYVLRNILTQLNNRLDTIEIKLMEIATVTQKLGVACGKAFCQTKTVIQALHDEQIETHDDICEYNGTVNMCVV